MSALAAAVEDYLGLRRSLGFTLRGIDCLLLDFVAHLERAGLETITTEAALAWATRPAGADPSWHAKRLGYVRRFALYLRVVDPRCQVPPADLLAERARRATPHLYRDEEVAALMAAARLLSPALRAATFHTVIGLLAVTGMRPGEVLRLDRADVDLDAGMVRVLDSKFHDSRELPLHLSTRDALIGYRRRCDQLCPKPTDGAFFISASGARLRHGALDQTFAHLRRQVGLQAPPRSGRGSPRLHDLRHRFAMRTVLGWYRAGADVEACLPALSTYLGHSDPTSTYWYLSATPELLAHAARRAGAHDGATP